MTNLEINSIFDIFKYIKLEIWGGGGGGGGYLHIVKVFCFNFKETMLL